MSEIQIMSRENEQSLDKEIYWTFSTLVDYIKWSTENLVTLMKKKNNTAEWELHS